MDNAIAEIGRETVLLRNFFQGKHHFLLFSHPHELFLFSADHKIDVLPNRCLATLTSQHVIKNIYLTQASYVR
jgi:hypothetical protein